VEKRCKPEAYASFGADDGKCKMDDVKKRLLEVIKGLNDRDRLIVIFYYLQGMNLKDMASILGIPLKNLSKLHAEILTKFSKAFLT